MLLAGCQESDSIEDVVIRFNPAAGEIAQDETVRYEISNDADEIIGHAVLTTTVHDGEILTLLEEYYRANESEPTDIIETHLLLPDFTPVQGQRVVKGNAEANIQEINYSWVIERSEDSEGQPRTYFVRANMDDQNQKQRVRLAKQETVYANSSGLWLWRALPHQIGLKTSYMAVDALNLKQQRVVVTVPQEESLVIGSKTYDVWRVLVRSGRATRSAWIEVANPNRILKWDNGVTVMTILE